MEIKLINICCAKLTLLTSATFSVIISLHSNLLQIASANKIWKLLFWFLVINNYLYFYRISDWLGIDHAHQIYLLVHVCIPVGYTDMHVGVHVDVYIYLEAWNKHLVLCWTSLHCILWDKISGWALNSRIQLHFLASKHQKISYSFLLITEITCMYCTSAFWRNDVYSNVRPHSFFPFLSYSI